MCFGVLQQGSFHLVSHANYWTIVASNPIRRLAAVTIVPIRLFGDPILRTPAEPVTVFDKELRQLVKDLEETMLDAPGAGLAANQIGVALRVFTYHVDDEQSGHLVNPVLHFPSDETQDGPEGCLSIPGLTFDCVRKQHVVAHGQNMYGDPITVEGTAKLSRAVQHETDHLDGVLFVVPAGPRDAQGGHARDPRGGVVGPVHPHGQGQPALR